MMGELERSHGTLKVIASGTDEMAIGRQYPLLAVTSIGRSPENSLVIDDDYTSNGHALISKRGGRWWLEDLNSRNGTLLNEMQLNKATVLSAGDVITIGSTRLRIDL
jgi:pSer/pThr/pTyr-binding forkhead associated (FHA) protein